MIIITMAAEAMIMAGRNEFVAGTKAPILEYITRRNSTSSLKAQLVEDAALVSAIESGATEPAPRLNQLVAERLTAWPA